MYTVKVDNDNDLTTTIYSKLIKSATGINSFHIIVPQTYLTAYHGEMDMLDFKATLIYLLPDEPDENYKTIDLLKSEVIYKDKYVEYILPNGTDFTSTVGYVRYKLMFQKTELDNVYIRETFPTAAYVYSNSLSDSIKIVTPNTGNGSSSCTSGSNFANIGGLATKDGKVYIVDTHGKQIGTSVTIEDAYIDKTIATGLKVIKI